MSDSPARGRHRRPDPRASATQAALIEAAEKLFGEFGINGVSMRQLGQAIGSGNSNVVAYHFGSKDDLVSAVIKHRLPAIEARRAELLASNTPDLPGLVDGLYRPFLEQTNAQGRHSYAAFLASLSRADLYAVREAVSGDYPHTTRLTGLIRASLPHLDDEQFRARVHQASSAIYDTLLLIDHAGAGVARAKRMFADAMSGIVALLRAPVVTNVSKRGEPTP